MVVFVFPVTRKSMYSVTILAATLVSIRLSGFIQTGFNKLAASVRVSELDACRNNSALTRWKPRYSSTLLAVQVRGRSNAVSVISLNDILVIL